tara:strand:+ start:3753 stop:4211 length:459 start_codon:yes stop_codon:yes gene_type:complete
MKPKIVYQPLGNSWAVGIESDDPEQIISQDRSWYNHGAYNGELKYMSDKFAYIWTTEEDLKNYFYKSSLAFILSKYDNQLRKKTKRYARILARFRFNDMAHETFISVSHDQLYRLALPSGHGGRSYQTGHYGINNDEEEWKQNCHVYFNFQA